MTLLAQAALLILAGAPTPPDPAAEGPVLPSVEDQMAAALQAAPEDMRAAATVLAYRAGPTLARVRIGKGDLVCLADDPAKDGFQAACYHRELEPYMARGRALRAQGVLGQDNRAQRWAEIEAGKLVFPKQPRALYVLHGAGWDPATKEVKDAYLRWVVFTPYATPESTGLTTQASPSAPWLMFPGTAGAHIMINPPQKK
ncbi:MAG: hypothetical protein AAFZ18_04570 [Myxococcota bacterium]